MSTTISSMLSSAASVAASSVPSSSSPAKKDNRVVILGVTLGIVAFLIIGIIIYATLRFHRRKNGANDDSFAGSARAIVLDRNHPASRITPFGSPGGEMPRFGFAHTPGANMRIATRRSDGAWQFSDPRAPFTPSGISDIDASPCSPSPSVRSSSLGPRKLTKEQEYKAARDRQKKEDFDMDPGPDVVPPPAYGYESEGYIDHTRAQFSQ